MDAVALLSSLNKIGLIAFLITLGFLIYELFLLAKSKKTDTAPQIPQFQENGQPLPVTPQIKEKNWKEMSKNNKILLIVLSSLLVFFGALTVISSLSGQSKQKTQTVIPTQTFSAEGNSRRVLPTGVVLAKGSPSPVSELISQAEEVPQEPTPTDYLLAAISPAEQVDEITDQADPVISQSDSEPTQLPTEINELPVTSYVNNLLVLFCVSAVFLFFAFLF